jgi:hypothetical protein
MKYFFFSGAFLEDAMVLSCGHSFGGLMLKKVLETVHSETLYSVFFYHFSKFALLHISDIKNKVLSFTLGIVLLDRIEINRYPEPLIRLIMVLYSSVCCICNFVVSRSIPYKQNFSVLEYSTAKKVIAIRSHIRHKKLIMI